jgi:phage terminase large subunit-like protein
MPAQPTKPGTRRLSELARHVVPPTGITSTAWPAVRAKCLELGVKFDDWQDGLGRAILAKRADGSYAAGVGGVVISIPRQVGKTYTVGAIVFALCILYPGLTVIWTAHRLKTAGETFRSMQSMARRQKIKPYIEQVFTGSGDEEVRFTNGSRILFGARERGFGRGFAEVDVEVFDEAQILTDRALDDMIPAMNQSKFPAGALMFFIGTPPKPTDPGEAFTAKRARALAGNSTDMLYVEFSADPDAHPDDRSQWSKANASYPTRTPASAMLRMKEALTEESFLREGLGIWDDVNKNTVVPMAVWAECLDLDSKIRTSPSFGLDVSPSRSWSAIAVAGKRSDELPHLEVAQRDGVVDHREGVEWVLPRLVGLKDRWPAMRLWVAAGSAAESLAPGITAAGIAVEVLPARDVAAACGLFYDLAVSRALRHVGQPQLTAALEGASKVDVGDGAFKWTRRKSTVDITPLYAATVALWAIQKHKPVPTVW